MKVLILEDDKNYQSSTERIFEGLGIETRAIYNQSESYDFVYIHFNGDFNLADEIKKKQPKCLLMVYSSNITSEDSEDSLNASLQRKLKEHFDELIYFDKRVELIYEIVRKKKTG